MAESGVCLVGAGFIADVHAEALTSLPETRISAVVDPNQDAAEALARKWRIDGVFTRLDDALASGLVDRAHVLVPPGLHHDLGKRLIEAGVPTLLEKPMAVSRSECEALVGLADEHDVALGVNQNFVYHPAFARLRRMVEAHQLGPLEFVDCIYSVPLRQLAGGPLGHWMFREPGNILLEQAVHPLSQITTLLGSISEIGALAAPPREISPGVHFYTNVGVTFESRRGPGQLHFAVGRSFGCWQLVAGCADGIIVADILNNRCFTYERGPWLEQVDGYFAGRKTGRAIARDARRNVVDFMLSTLRLKPPSAPFFLSMAGSLSAFHAALDAGRRPPLDGAFGSDLVGLCEQITKAAFTPKGKRKGKAPALVTKGDYDVALLGGTGFIGGHTVRAFRAAGKRVGVMARNTANLPATFFDKGVVVIQGDVTRRADVETVIGGATRVVNLAHGGGGGDWDAVRRAMVDSARMVGEVCLDRKVERLVHVGSIAGLYLGDAGEVVTGATPVDPRAHERADYSRGKAESDRAMLDLHKSRGLPVCILRPGVVIGEGGLPFHSGLGNFNNEQHCVGWNAGTNMLPFVLVEDVADAIVKATAAEGVDGRCYNLVGDVEMSAQAYITALAQVLNRPIRFYPQSPAWFQAGEILKWMVKRAGGRKAAFPSYRDLKSRGLVARFDITDAKHDLGWQPEADTGAFIRRGIDIHAPKAA